MSPIKEPRYFAPGDDPGYGVRPIWDQAKYLRLFRGVKDEVAVGEASVSYLRDPESPRLIHEAVPHARIIIILRDPVERAYAHYLMYVRETWESLPFEEAARNNRYLVPGFYAAPVKRYLDIFGPEQIEILIFEEFIQETARAVRQVLKFLSVSSEPPANVTEAYNVFATPRGPLARLILGSKLAREAGHTILPAPLARLIREKVLFKKTNEPPMPPEARKFLEELYREDVKKLAKILGRSLPWFLARD